MRRHYALFTLLPVLAAVSPAPSHAQILSITIAPPALPVYVQPAIPAPGYIWTPGYWAYGDAGYFWVPGTWVLPPSAGLLWTPGYWGWREGVYAWNGGYWGPTVGFYGGVNYGFGYGGVGFAGGEWRGGVFAYNRSVNNFGTVNITNVYNKTVIVNNNHVAFNGGAGGLASRPNAAEMAAVNQHHIAPTAMQTQHQQTASTVRENFASVNHGAPTVAATAHAGQFSGAGVVGAHGTPNAGGLAHGPGAVGAPNANAAHTPGAPGTPGAANANAAHTPGAPGTPCGECQCRPHAGSTRRGERSSPAGSARRSECCQCSSCSGSARPAAGLNAASHPNPSANASLHPVSPAPAGAAPPAARPQAAISQPPAAPAASAGSRGPAAGADGCGTARSGRGCSSRCTCGTSGAERSSAGLERTRRQSRRVPGLHIGVPARAGTFLRPPPGANSSAYGDCPAAYGLISSLACAVVAGDSCGPTVDTPHGAAVSRKAHDAGAAGVVLSPPHPL